MPVLETKICAFISRLRKLQHAKHHKRCDEGWMLLYAVASTKRIETIGFLFFHIFSSFLCPKIICINCLHDECLLPNFAMRSGRSHKTWLLNGERETFLWEILAFRERILRATPKKGFYSCCYQTLSHKIGDDATLNCPFCSVFS